MSISSHLPGESYLHNDDICTPNNFRPQDRVHTPAEARAAFRSYIGAFEAIYTKQNKTAWTCDSGVPVCKTGGCGYGYGAVDPTVGKYVLRNHGR